MEERSLFFQLGHYIYRGRVFILLVWLMLVIACVPFLSSVISPFKNTGFVDETSSSVKADNFLDKQLGFGKKQLLITYHSDDLETNQPIFLKKIKKSLVDLIKFSLPYEIIYPGPNNKKQYSQDKHNAYVVVSFKSAEKLTPERLIEFKSLIKQPTNMTMLVGGEPIFIQEVNQQTQKDLYKADMVAAPISIIILIIVFGSLVAASIPMILGGSCALLILISLYILGHFFNLSIFTLNIALLLGLCLSLDYCLFFISRFREELKTDKSLEEVLSITLATAGKAIFFSGLAVFISLSALLFFPINILFSIGVGGLTAVFVAVLISIWVLPAILAIIGPHINRLPVAIFKHNQTTPPSFWKKLAQIVVKMPFLFFISALTFLLFLGSPFLKVQFGIADLHILPKHSESSQFFNNYKRDFNENELTPIVLLLHSETDKRILSKPILTKLYNFAEKLKENPAIKQINSIVSTNTSLTANQYYLLYKSKKNERGNSVNQLLKTTTGDKFTIMAIISKFNSNSPQTKALVNEIKQMNPGIGLRLEVTGVPVNNIEVLDRIKALFPFTLVWIISLTYLILLILLRSLFLPFKAILMNLISLTASYGVLVFIFQQGHFHEWLNFQPQAVLDTSLLIIIFCALFGFSMDYEVFLLTRIKEHYVKTLDNNQSIVYGIANSSKIITSAAIIVIFLCGSFMVADVLMVKEFGLGIAVAIFVDAFIVRSILVPSTMALVKQWNWYLPQWLNKLLPKW